MHQSSGFSSSVAYSLEGKRIFVAGHGGMVGHALVRRLSRLDCETVTASRNELDLRDQAAVFDWFAHHRPQAVINAAGTVGGIMANWANPAFFIYDNLAIAMNVVEASRREKVEKLLYLGSNCIYPKFASVPTLEATLLSGGLELTNEPYAVAKIAGIKLCQAYRQQHGCNFISAVPTSLYGPCDNFDPETSHVLPALMGKFHRAKLAGEPVVSIWGSGRPGREFLHVDDLADACVFLLERYDEDAHINVGYGTDITIADLAKMIAQTVGWNGELAFDTGKPDGTPRKLLDVSGLSRLGWRARTSLLDGLRSTYEWYLDVA